LTAPAPVAITPRLAAGIDQLRRFVGSHDAPTPIQYQEVAVNKSELIEQIATQADMSKAAAGRALEAAVEAVTKALKKGDTVSLVGFGTFYVGKRAARTGRNPRTGAELKIKAAKTPKFRPGKTLKDSVN